MIAKYDLNLLPRREKSPAFRQIGLPFIITGAILAVAVVLGIVIPNTILTAKLVEKAALENQIEGQAEVEKQYTEVMAEFGTVQNKLASADAFGSEGHPAAELLDFLEAQCPADVLLLTADFDIAGASLTGIAPTDTSIAQFAINIRSSQRFGSVSIISVQPLEGLSKVDNTSPRLFSFRLEHPVAEETEGAKK